MRGLLVTTALAVTGCGSTLWLVTPRPEVTHYEVTRLQPVAVTTTPPGAMVYIDGAEAGAAPRRVAVPYKEVRRQRRQAVWPAIVGTGLDLAAGLLFTIVALENDAPEAAALIAGGTAGVLLLDLHLITGRSVVNEGQDVVPTAVEIGVRAPGFADAARRVRVPDFTELRFQLIPGAQMAPAPAAIPPPTPPPPPAPR